MNALRTIALTGRAAVLLLAGIGTSLAAAVPAGARRAANYEEALALAAESHQDIVVYQRGSDWNRLGERLLVDVWQRPELARELGDQFILVVVDRPEAVGAPPVKGECLDQSEPASGSAPAAGSPLDRLRAVTDAKRDLAPCDVTAVDASDKSTFERQPDGSFLATGANPAHETLTLHLKPRVAGQVLRLDFPPHDSLPGRGPGRASNGNFAVCEIRVTGPGGSPIALTAAWANASEGQWGPWLAVDGIADKGDAIWNPAAHHHQLRTLLATLEKPVAAGSEVSVQLVCRSQWPQHVPGCLRAAILADGALAADVRATAAAELEGVKNAKFTWRGSTIPRIALMDHLGRPVTSEDKPRLGLTPATLAVRVREMQAMRIRRDELWQQADKAQGTRKAETLMQSLQLLGLDGSPGHENCYKFVQDQMRAADPQDESGCIRWLQFQPDPRIAPALLEPANKLAAEKKYEEALAAVDRELAHPGNRRLNHDQIQRIMMGKYHVYRQWPGHEDQRLDVLRAIAALDADTYLGLGATGYLAMFFKTPKPVGIDYGWNAAQVQAGPDRWDLTLGAANHFDHAGKFCLRILHNGGKDSLKIRRVALLDGSTVLSESSPDADLAPGGKLEVTLELKTHQPNRKLTVRLEVAAQEGKTDVAGRFEIDPLL